ncbi:MAG: DNA polymerase I [Bacteroidetes bacterium]|nr:DNA polymerase I [Bacteroidota bacterium]
MKDKKFVIIDALAMAYKAYYAFINRPLVTSKGEPTSAVYGFISQLLKVLEDHKPDYIAVAFDSKEKTFRHEKYEGYKSSRSAMPDDMIPQIARIKEVVEDLNMPVWIKPGYEADDIVGTAVKKAEEKGLISYAITPDKDYFQLVTDKVTVIRPGRATDDPVEYDVKKVKEELGFNPPQMIDYLAIIGDSSDDIPGVAGIGPKGALPLIQKYKTIEGIYENLDKIEKAGIKKKLIDSKENAFLSKELATIYCDVPMEIDFDHAKFEEPNFDKLKELFIELEFKTLYNRLLKVYNNSSETGIEAAPSIKVLSFEKSKSGYKLITGVKDAKQLAEKLKKKSLIVFDTETDGLNPYELNIVGASFATKAGEGIYVAVDPSSGNNKNIQFKDGKPRLPVNEFVKIFKPVFQDKKIKKVCQNGKFDISVMRSINVKVENFYFDTMLASYILDPDQKHGMDELSAKYLNYKPIPLSDLLGKKKDPTLIYDVDVETLSDYAAEDADITWRLYEKYSKEKDLKHLKKVFYGIEMPLLTVLGDMELRGIKIDVKFLNNLDKKFGIRIKKLEIDIYKLAGTEFNVASPLQLKEVLFDKLKISTEGLSRTKTGISTSAQDLEKMKGRHKIIELIMEFRELSKLKNTYTDALPKLVNQKTGRVHTSFNQTVAATGRLSSTNPNLQNIPIRGDFGKKIRQAFVASPGYSLVSFDYSQIDLRAAAILSQDEGLLEIFKEGKDIHSGVAMKVFGVSEDKVTEDMRRQAKVINFGIIYGMVIVALQKAIGATRTEAKKFLKGKEGVPIEVNIEAGDNWGDMKKL